MISYHRYDLCNFAFSAGGILTVGQLIFRFKQINVSTKCIELMIKVSACDHELGIHPEGDIYSIILYIFIFFYTFKCISPIFQPKVRGNATAF